MKVSTLILGMLLSLGALLQAQDSPEAYVQAFRAMRLSNGHSTYTLNKNELQVMIAHRFGGTIDQGVEELFGMDQFANIRLGVSYGATDRLTIGLGRSRVRKVYDGFLKYSLLRQNEAGMPVSVSALVAASMRSDDWPDTQRDFLETRHRLSYTTQLLIARELAPFVSVQLSPTWVHRNLVVQQESPTDVWALGMGTQVRINGRILVSAEYFLALTELNPNQTQVYDAFALGINFETARHAFQVVFSNATEMIEPAFIANTADDFWNKGIHIGFNISRNLGGW